MTFFRVRAPALELRVKPEHSGHFKSRFRPPLLSKQQSHQPVACRTSLVRCDRTLSWSHSRTTCSSSVSLHAKSGRSTMDASSASLLSRTGIICRTGKSGRHSKIAPHNQCNPAKSRTAHTFVDALAEIKYGTFTPPTPPQIFGGT